MFIYKALSAIAAAAFGAAIVLALPGFSPEVEASTPAQMVAAGHLDIQPVATTPDCTQQAWPYYDASCLRSTRANTQPRTVRVVTTDRMAR
jgi:hypothetical protein